MNEPSRREQRTARAMLVLALALAGLGLAVFEQDSPLDLMDDAPGAPRPIAMARVAADGSLVVTPVSEERRGSGPMRRRRLVRPEDRLPKGWFFIEGVALDRSGRPLADLVLAFERLDAARSFRDALAAAAAWKNRLPTEAQWEMASRLVLVSNEMSQRQWKTLAFHESPQRIQPGLVTSPGDTGVDANEITSFWSWGTRFTREATNTEKSATIVFSGIDPRGHSYPTDDTEITETPDISVSFNSEPDISDFSGVFPHPTDDNEVTETPDINEVRTIISSGIEVQFDTNELETRIVQLGQALNPVILNLPSISGNTSTDGHRDHFDRDAFVDLSTQIVGLGFSEGIVDPTTGKFHGTTSESAPTQDAAWELVDATIRTDSRGRYRIRARWIEGTRTPNMRLTVLSDDMATEAYADVAVPVRRDEKRIPVDSATLRAEELIVAGRVIDGNGFPIAGAVIYVEGTTCRSGRAGEFSLRSRMFDRDRLEAVVSLTRYQGEARKFSKGEDQMQLVVTRHGSLRGRARIDRDANLSGVTFELVNQDDGRSINLIAQKRRNHLNFVAGHVPAGNWTFTVKRAELTTDSERKRVVRRWNIEIAQGTFIPDPEFLTPETILEIFDILVEPGRVCNDWRLANLDLRGRLR